MYQNNEFSQSLIQTFGFPGEGPQVLDYLIEKIHKNVAVWTSEADIVIQVSFQTDKSIVDNVSQVLFS